MFRTVGIEERVREQSKKDFVPEGAIVALDYVAGRKLADIIPNLNEGVDALSPCRRLFLNQPSLEPILRFFPGVDLVDLMRKQCADLRLVRLFEGAGHWVQQERPAEVNAALLEFLGGL